MGTGCSTPLEVLYHKKNENRGTKHRMGVKSGGSLKSPSSQGDSYPKRWTSPWRREGSLARHPEGEETDFYARKNSTAGAIGS